MWRGQCYLSPLANDYMCRAACVEAPCFKLAPNERQVLHLLAQGLGTTEIAAEMGIDPRTVQILPRLSALATRIATASPVVTIGLLDTSGWGAGRGCGSTVLDRLCHPPTEPAVPLRWIATLERVLEACGGDPLVTAPFVEAWRICYAATLLLDHVQDGDPLRDAWVAQQPHAVQYHLAISLYVRAHYVLAQLDPARLDPLRICRLQQYWATMVAQMAAGQYLDLTSPREAATTSAEAALDTYARIAAHKTGATFALAFGGAAILTSDEAALTATLEQLGMIYGMVLQYADDLIDAPQQRHQPTSWTLPHALQAAQASAMVMGEAEVIAFWHVIIETYAPAFAALCAQTPPRLAACLDDLWRSTVVDVCGAPSAVA